MLLLMPCPDPTVPIWPLLQPPPTLPPFKPLSPLLISISLPLNFSALPVLQSACPSVQSMLSSSTFSIVSIPFLQSSVLCDASSGSPRPLIPKVLRQKRFQSLHGISHPGVCASRRVLSSRFVWPGLAKDVGLWTRSCGEYDNLSAASLL